MKSKKGVEGEALLWYIVAITILVIIVGSYFALRKEGVGVLDFISKLFRFWK